MADVSVYDDHVQTIDKLKVKPGKKRLYVKNF